MFDKIFDGAVGSVVSGLFGSRQAAKQMDFQAGQTAQQMEFQERMARNAHRYQVEDLRGAGLNPILSASQGGASAMPGASGSGAMTGVDPVHSGISLARSMQEIKMLMQQTRKLELENKGQNKAQSDFWDSINPWSIKERYDKTHPTSAKHLPRASRATAVPDLKILFDDVQKYKDSVDTDVNP